MIYIRLSYDKLKYTCSSASVKTCQNEYIQFPLKVKKKTSSALSGIYITNTVLYL